MSKKVLSLFSGAMGLDLGLESAGMNVVLSCDFDKNVGETMKLNNRNHIIGDLQELIFNDPNCNFIKEKIDCYDDLFAVVGGPPCQPFSTAGKRNGFSDVRGSLFKEFHHVIKTFKPRFFIMENVKGLLSLTNEEKKPYIDIIIELFEEIGYSTEYELLNSVFYGTPQHRERLILIGSRDGEKIFFPQPTHFKLHQNKNYRWQTLNDAFININYDNDKSLNLPSSRSKFLPLIPEGGNWRDLSEPLQKEALGGAFSSGGGKTGFYRRLSFDLPSPTLTTNPLQKSTMLLHPTENRGLSVNEYKRIQQFPDDWIIGGTLNSQYKQIGNAVPIGFAKALGENLITISENSYESTSKRKTKPFLNEKNLILLSK